MDLLFANIPIWGIFVGTLFLVLASMEVGYLSAKKRQDHRELAGVMLSRAARSAPSADSA